MENIISNTNHFGLPGNDYGLVDKQDQALGLSEVNLKNAQPLITQRDHTLTWDTRDCLGILSLREAQLSFSYTAATDGLIPPQLFKESLNNNGQVDKERLLNVVQGMNITGFPENSGESPIVSGNIIRFKLPKTIKQVKSLEIINAIIPRDIIPVYIYFPDFINNCLPLQSTNFLSPSVEEPNSTWLSPIPATYEDFFEKNVPQSVSNRLSGVYYTPLRYWRTYTGPNSMPNPHTPPPYNLWNPPQDNSSINPWPFQPQPIRGQRIPTYVARNGVVFSGYGLYDLDDFPETQELRLTDGNTIQIPMRKLLLKLIVPQGQYVGGRSVLDIIDDSTTNDLNNQGIVTEPSTQTGYGDYQRFLPGPGLGMAYQPNQPRPGKSAPIELALSTYDPTLGYLGPMPVPFPTFRGNVWGPYGRPGDRFQNMGLQLTIDELYLNGDLSNLEGNDIIWPQWDPSQEPYRFEYYILSLRRPRTDIRFSNFETSANPNIKNAMRVQFAGGYGSTTGYIGVNTTTRGGLGLLITRGLPNTQYDGNLHPILPSKWVTPAKEFPITLDDSLPGPQKPSLVADSDPQNFQGWPYIWRTTTPQVGNIYVPVTGGGVGPMSRWDTEAWIKSGNLLENGTLTTGSSQWANSPVVGQSNVWCIPSPNTETNQIVSNVPWGRVQSVNPWAGGTGYQDTFPDYPTDDPTYRLARYTNVAYGQEGIIEVDTVGSLGEILTLNSFDIAYTGGDDIVVNTVTTIPGTTGIPASGNTQIPTTGDNCAWRINGVAGTVVLHVGGNEYTVAQDVGTKAQTGTGSGLTVNITGVVDLGPEIEGVIDTIEIVNPGSGYVAGDVVALFQTGSNNNALFQITDATVITTDIIPENNIWHYHDPQATGPSGGGTLTQQTQNLINGVDICTSDCPDNCTPAAGEYVIDIGETSAALTDILADPRPTPDPPELLKCDFVDQEGPETEWAAEIALGSANCRPLDTNSRIKQSSNYVDRRVAYQDFGQNNGTLITNLLNYRNLFVSSTPNTDLVMTIKQAQRNIYSQHINENLMNSNFNIPIRLNLGTTSGTLEYVEAVQGTLTSSGVYWKKNFYPPVAKMGDLEMSFTTYDGTPIPLERTLGFSKLINEQATLLSSSIVSENTIHGSYSLYSPNLPPFVSVGASSPSSVLLAGTSSSKGLSDTFNPKLVQYTQRNLSMTLRVVNYHAVNPGTQEMIKKMPEALVDHQEKTSEEFTDLVPVAHNLDEYY